MKTIEQHLQDLFVGKRVKIQSIVGNVARSDIGICLSFNQIDTKGNKDVYQLTIENTTNYWLYSDDERDLIEILT